LKEKPSIKTELFEDLWHHVKEEVTQKDDYNRYMSKSLEGTLWLREAWLQAQYHGPQLKLIPPIFVGLSTAIVQMFMAILTHRDNILRRICTEELGTEWEDCEIS
jgi:hypothetical protein